MSAAANADALPYAHGGPALRVRLRAQPDDFYVDEDLGFAPDGAGEHHFVRVEKRGANTDWVARELARYAGVAPDAVSYAGLKDRHAVTRQTFSVHIPGKREVDWAALSHPEFRVLEAARHGRKLKRGALRGNRFVLVLREAHGDRAAAQERIAAIAARGVPNYFGEQRFGRDGANVERARAMFAGARVQRHERSMLLSAARSALFNTALARRVADGTWDAALPGEVWMLDGRNSIFGPEAWTEALAERLRSGDIHPTGPLWGRGELRSSETVRELELAAAAALGDVPAGLERAGLDQERRSLRLKPADFACDEDARGLVLSFSLPAGAYATVVLREVCDWETAASPVLC